MTLALGLWTRFQPMTQTLIKKLHDEKVIGDIKAVKTDFSMPFLRLCV
jgi:predicted dehydrogenase